MRFVIATVGATLAGVVILYLFATFLRRTSMFFPEHGDAQTPPEAEDVTFTTDDGVPLHGWWFQPPRTTTSPLLLWFHGNAGDITSRAPIAVELARRGVPVVLFDYRGYGKSGGTPGENALYRDAEAAFRFASARATNIVLYGESLGGPYAAYVASRHRIRGVVIENSFPSLRALGNALYAPLPLGWFAPMAMRTSHWLNRAGVPVLLMHGRRDGVIPFALGMQLYDELHVPKTLLVSDTAGHCEIAAVDAERYYDAVVRFVTR